MDTAALIVACAAVAVGAGLQRVAGMGVGLVAAPLLALVLGPVVGVVVSNAAAVVTALLVLAALRARVDWRRFAVLAPLIVVGSVLGALAVRAGSTAWLDVLLGGTVLLALGVTAALRRRAPSGGRPAAVAAGLAAGFMNTTSGIAAPAMTAYALATRWEHRRFAATLQPVFLLANVSAIVTKALLGAVDPATAPPWWVWPLVVVAVLVGVALGSRLALRVTARAAARVAITVACGGGVTALARGLLAL